MDFQNIRVIGSAGWFFNRNEPFSKGVFVTYLCVFFPFCQLKVIIRLSKTFTGFCKILLFLIDGL